MTSERLPVFRPRGCGIPEPGCADPLAAARCLSAVLAVRPAEPGAPGPPRRGACLRRPAAGFRRFSRLVTAGLLRRGERLVFRPAPAVRLPPFPDGRGGLARRQDGRLERPCWVV